MRIDEKGSEKSSSLFGHMRFNSGEAVGSLGGLFFDGEKGFEQGVRECGVAMASARNWEKASSSASERNKLRILTSRSWEKRWKKLASA